MSYFTYCRTSFYNPPFIKNAEESLPLCTDGINVLVKDFSFNESQTLFTKTPKISLSNREAIALIQESFHTIEDIKSYLLKDREALKHLLTTTAH